MSRFTRSCIAILAVTLTIRLVLLGVYPLADTTEARYSEIARLMLASGDWITLQVEAGVPFWGKPPLSTWLTALSFRFFGVTEFAARLPAVLLLMASAALMIRFAAATDDRNCGLVATCILLTSLLGFIAAGAVMTDAALLFACTLAMVSFWRGSVDGEPRWVYLFFVALGLGLLAKGPVAWVLCLLPIVLWCAWRRRRPRFGTRLAWLAGPALALLIAVPWYVAAELRTPGFLEYFLLGEHWLRFVDSGWPGDRYGSAHAETRGTIWLFWIAAALPWSLVALAAWTPWRRRQSGRAWSDWQRYLLLWAMTPMLFFSFAGNILPAYVLPGLPAFALLLGRSIAARKSSLLHAAWAVPVLLLLTGPTLLFDRMGERSQRDLILGVEADGGAAELMYLFNRPHSANFYSAGAARFGGGPDDAMQHLDAPGLQFVAVRSERQDALPAVLQARLQVMRSYGKFVLLRETRVRRRSGNGRQGAT